MFFVGIDVASQKHDCCVLDAQGKVCAEFQIRNNRDGFDYLLEILSQLDSAENIKIGLEATGIYSTNLLAFLRRNGFEATTFNPLHIKKRLSATTLRKTKTDKSDAKFIADTVMHETSQPDTPVSYHISELKSLTRFRFQLVQDCSRAKIQAKAALHTLFPEFSSAFSDVFGASAKAILSKYPSAADVANCRISSLEKVLSSASRGRFGRAKAEELKQLAKQSIGVFSAAKALALQSYLQQIQLFEAQVAEVDRQIKAIMDEIDSPILSVPGIGYTLGATILAEIGDVHRFLRRLSCWHLQEWSRASTSQATSNHLPGRWSNAALRIYAGLSDKPRGLFLNTRIHSACILTRNFRRKSTTLLPLLTSQKSSFVSCLQSSQKTFLSLIIFLILPLDFL